MIGSVHKELANDIAILKSVEGDFEKFVEALRPRSQEEWTCTKWLEISRHMAEYAPFQIHNSSLKTYHYPFSKSWKVIESS